MSTISTTTRGGDEFEQLCQGRIKNYSFNLADIESERKVKHIKRKLVKQLESTINELELHSDRRIGKIYIGKTFIQRKRKPGGGFMTFNPLNHNTWEKNGISSRWGSHKHEDYGRDGLVVLGAITKQTVPEKCRDRVHQEDFTLAMEQKLLHHYLLSHPDSRVVNDTFTAGRPPERNHYAYAVYMAFSYTDDDVSKGFNFNEEDNLEQDIPSSPQPPDDSCTNTGGTSQTAIDVVQGTDQTTSNYTPSEMLPAGPTIRPNDRAPPLSLSTLMGINFDHSPSPPSPPSPPPLPSPPLPHSPPPLTSPPPHSPPVSHPPRSKKRKFNSSTRQKRKAQASSSQNLDQACSSSSHCTIPTPHRLFTTEQRPEDNLGFRFVENYTLQRFLADQTLYTPQEEQPENGTSQSENGTSQTKTEGRPGNAASSSETVLVNQM